MVARCALLVMLGACGRIAFDPTSTSTSGGDGGPTGDGVGDTTMLGSDGSADPWWDSKWQRRIRLSIADPGQPLTAFPLMVRLTNQLSYLDTQDAGQDLRFVAADQMSVLAHEIEIWNESGASFVWVNVPVISGADAHIWLYYANPVAIDTQNPSGVWSGHRLVWHLVENPTAGAPQMRDSSGNANQGTATGAMPAGSQMAGVVGGSLGFDGNNDWITAPNSASLQLTGNITVSVWVNRNTTTREEWLCDFTTPASEQEGNNHLYELSIDQNNLVSLDWEFNAGSDNDVQSSAAVNTGAGLWVWIAAVRDTAANTVRFYENGVQIGNPISYTNDPTGGTTASLWLGGMNDGGSSKNPLLGRLDELRIESVVRSPAWLLAQYRSMTDMTITYGAPEVF